MGNLDLVEEEESIVHAVVAKLRANITDVDALQWLVRLHVPDLADERMRSVALALDNELRHHHRVIRSPSKGANPPLRSGKVGRVEDEGLVLRIPRGGGLEAANVRAMAQLGLCIAANGLVVLCRLEEEFLLLGSALTAKSRLEDG